MKKKCGLEEMLAKHQKFNEYLYNLRNVHGGVGPEVGSSDTEALGNLLRCGLAKVLNVCVLSVDEVGV